MSKERPRMGTPAWANSVFASGAARVLKGHWRHTQWHGFESSGSCVFVEVQGRNELCAALALEYLRRMGHITRFKPQPFRTDQQEFGAEICPDFLAEGPGASLYVIEVKSARFLTRLKHVELEDNRERFAAYGMKYLVWTDERPLSHAVRHNLTNMRASTQRDVRPEEIQSLVDWLAGRRLAACLVDLYAAGFDRECLWAAAWDAKVFFPITKLLSPETRVASRALENYGSIFLDCRNEIEDWWCQLQVC